MQIFALISTCRSVLLGPAADRGVPSNSGNGKLMSVTAAPASGAQWIVLKFGGTSVSTRPRWDKIAAIAKAWRAQGKYVVIVVSALSGITDKLKAICDGHADAARCRAVADEI